MRTTIDIDERLLNEFKRLSGARTNSDAVNLALKEAIQRRRVMELMKLEGKVVWEGDLNKMRETEL